MGVVYRARQHGVIEREVALKIAHAPLGGGGRSRLAAERQALARLNHPHIARMLEAGNDEAGHPYFVMELVEEAEPIHTYCDRHGLGLRSRIELLLEACAGVQHAHQQAVVHRDLKPSNVLVAEVEVEGESKPTVKIIDFGIARLIDADGGSDLTVAGMLGTPSYMSPEHLSLDRQPTAGRIDTRADVYSLGVMLFELLVGELPHARAPEASPLAHLRQVAEADVERASRRWAALAPDVAEARARARRTSPAAVRRQLASDLDWVIARATARDPAERYQSVSELGAELRRVLDDQPVLAGPPSTLHRARKFVRRQRLPLAALAALFAVLVGGLVARGVEVERARLAAAEARQAQAVTERVARFMSDLFTAADPRQHLGEEITAGEALQRGADRLMAGDLDESARVRARLLITVGAVQWRRGDPAAGLPLAEKALEVISGLPPEEQGELGLALQVVGTLASEVGDYARSDRLLQEALALREEEFGRTSVEAVNTLINLGAIRRETGRVAEAAEIQREVLARVRARGDTRGVQAQIAWHNLAVALRWLQRFDEAEEAEREALALALALFPDRHPTVALAWQNLGDLYVDWNRLDDAKAALESARVRHVAVHGDDHPDLARTHTSLGNAHRAGGAWEAAAESYRTAESIYRRAGSRLVVNPAGSRVLLAADRGDHRRAVDLAESFFAAHTADFGTAHWLAFVRCSWAGSALALGEVAAAAEQLAAALPVLARETARDDRYAHCLVQAGRLATAEGDLAAASARFEEALAAAGHLPLAGAVRGNALLGQARIAMARGHRDEARRLAESARDVLAASRPGNHADHGEVRRLLAALEPTDR